MQPSIVIQVPPDDRESLLDLKRQINAEGPIMESRPFDGTSVMQIVTVLSPATYPFFRTWLRARCDRLRETAVTIDGIELKGYSVDEVERILDSINQRLEN